MTLASDHVCFRRGWDVKAAHRAAAQIVVALFVSCGLQVPPAGIAGELWEEALRALLIFHLFRDDRYAREQVAREVGMRPRRVQEWWVLMKAGPQLHRLRSLGETERAVAAVIERRLPHADERARMEGAWKETLDYVGIADEAMIPPALQQELLDQYYERAGLRMNDREVRAFLSDRLNRQVTPLEVQKSDVRGIVESGNFLSGDLTFILTAEGFHVPALVFSGGNPIRVLFIKVCREGSRDIEAGIRQVVRVFGKPSAFLHDDAKGYFGRFPLRCVAALGMRSLSGSVGDARWEGLMTHIKDAAPIPSLLRLEEVPEVLASIEVQMGPGAGELGYAPLAASDLEELRLSRRAVVAARNGTVRYLRLEAETMKIAEGTPVQVAVRGAGIVAVRDDYGVVRDQRGWWAKAGASDGPTVLGVSEAASQGCDLADRLDFARESHRLADELVKVLPVEMGGEFRRRSRQIRPTRVSLPPIRGALSGTRSTPLTAAESGTPAAPVEGPPAASGGGGGGIEPRAPESEPAVPHLNPPQVGDERGWRAGDDQYSGGATPEADVVPGHQPANSGDQSGLRDLPSPQVVALDDPRAPALIRASGGDPTLYSALAERGDFIALAPYAKGHPAEMALAFSLGPTPRTKVNAMVLVHDGSLSYYGSESIIADSMTVHSGLKPARVDLSPEAAAQIRALHKDLMRAAALVEDRQKCRELIGEMLPRLDDWAIDEGAIANKMRNVRIHVERADSLLLAGHLSEAEGALIHGAGLLPVRGGRKS